MVKINNGTYITMFTICGKMPANRYMGMTKNDGPTSSVHCFTAFRNFLGHLLQESYFEETHDGLLDLVTSRELVIQLQFWTEAEYQYEIQYPTDWAGRNIASRLLRIMDNPFIGSGNFDDDPIEADTNGFIMSCVKARLIRGVRFLTRVINCIKNDPCRGRRKHMELKSVIDEVMDKVCGRGSDFSGSPTQ